MLGEPRTLFRILGFEIRVDWTWYLILVLVIWTLASGVFPHSLPAYGDTLHLALAVVAAFGLFASIVLHELAHALVARRLGLTMRGITLFIFGGVAQMDEEPPSAGVEWRVALAGPAMSAALAATLWLLAVALGGVLPEPAITLLLWLALMNAVLMGFNLVPAFPLDGGRVLRALLWRRSGDLGRATETASAVGRGLGWGLVGLGVLQILMGFGLAGAWWILIGLFIRHAAAQGVAMVLAREGLQGRPVRAFLSEHPVTVTPDVTLQDLVARVIGKHKRPLYPVTRGGRLEGCVCARDLRRVPRASWPTVAVAEIARPCTDENSIEAEADAYDALVRMVQQRRSHLVVREGALLAGLVSLQDLTEYLTVNLELKALSR